MRDRLIRFSGILIGCGLWSLSLAATKSGVAIAPWWDPHWISAGLMLAGSLVIDWRTASHVSTLGSEKKP